jgi:hypothetical protein
VLLPLGILQKEVNNIIMYNKPDEHGRWENDTGRSARRHYREHSLSWGIAQAGKGEDLPKCD